MSFSDYPLISVITAVYNAEKYLKGCISSVLEQSYKNFEYIIIDGGSTDGTIDIIKKYQNQIAYWVSEPDKGIYDAWNKGLSVAKGDWIVFVGADDLLYPDAFMIYIQHIIKHSKQRKLEFISSQIELVNEDLSLIRIVGSAWDWELFQREMNTWHVGCFHSKSLFLKYGVFNPVYKVSGDYEFLLRPKNTLIASFINQSTAKMRVGGTSNINLFRAINETYNAKIENGVISFIAGETLKIIDKIRIFVRMTLANI